jgi:hypothetical protein
VAAGEGLVDKMKRDLYLVLNSQDNPMPRGADMATAVEPIDAFEDEGVIAEPKASTKPASAPIGLTLEQANKLAAGRPFELIKEGWFSKCQMINIQKRRHD